MTPTQQLIWTALPNSFVGMTPASGLRLSVFISPRLHLDPGDPATLDPFKDWLHWPGTVIVFGTAAIAGDKPSAVTRSA